MLNLAFSYGRSSSRPSRGALLGVALVALPLLMTVAGCGGARGAGGGNFPAPDAAPQVFADYLADDWTAILNSDAPDAIRVPMRLQVAGAQGPNFPVSGTVADAELQTGGFSVAGGAPTLRFTTESLTVQGPTGPVEVAGPVTWFAVVQQGRLVGSATGPDGQTGQWEAEKQ